MLRNERPSSPTARPRRALLPALVAALVSASPHAAQTGSGDRGPVGREPVLRLYAATRDGFGSRPGEVVRIQPRSPRVDADVRTLAATDGGLRLRAFGRFLFVTNSETGTLTLVERSGSGSRVYHLGAESRPQDVLVVGRRAYVTRRDEPRLLHLDLVTGATREATDLGVLAGEGEVASLRMMERDGSRLFVQVGLARVDERGLPRPGGALLAVVDLSTERLIDADPAAEGVQGIALQGAPPRLRMQVLEETRTLFVSTTDERLDDRGGIEMVDLEMLSAVGYAASEHQVGADLGGFVMTSPAGGYLVFHTDIVASTHLKPFTIADGTPPGPELFVLLGDAVETLVYDAARQRLYIPSGFAGFGVVPGIHVLDTETNRVAAQPILTGFMPHDLVLAR